MNESETGCEPLHDVHSVWIEYVVLAVQILFILLTLIGNIFVIFKIVFEKNFEKNITIYAVSLAGADFLVGASAMTFSVYFSWAEFVNSKNYRETALCISARVFDILSSSSSMVHVQAMTVDRFVAICYPLKYHMLLNKRRTKFILFSCWILPAIFSLLMVLPVPAFHGSDEGLSTHNSSDKCIPQCIFRLSLLLSTIPPVFSFYVTSFIMLYLNIKTFIAVKKRRKHLAKCEGEISVSHRRSKQLLDHAETKVAKTSIILLICFYICWLPFFVYTSVDPLIGYATPDGVVSFLTWLGYVNSAFDPVMYYVFFIRQR